jgi:hypothetical protein
MSYASQLSVFRTHKSKFISTVNNVQDAISIVGQESFESLHDAHLLIEQQLEQMRTVLETKNSQDKTQWLDCFYFCIMLEKYYREYDKQDKAKKFAKLSRKIALKCELTSAERQKVSEQVSRDLVDENDQDTITVKLRSWLGEFNMYRLTFAFSRVTMRQFLLLNPLGESLKINDMVTVLDAPGDIFNALSVGIFAVRLSLNLALIFKHLFAPTDKEANISFKKRLFEELYKRHYHLLNDIAWGTVNLFCNYSAVFNLAAPVANWLTAGFLVFDMLLLLWSRHLLQEEYLVKKSQYTCEIVGLEELLRRDLSKEERQKHDNQLEFVKAQAAQLELGWQKTNAAFQYSIGAALVFTAGFTAAFLFTVPAATVACYFVCTIAVAMYMTADAYGVYRQKAYVLEQTELAQTDPKNAQAELATARKAFISSMFKHTFIPLAVVTLYATCWPAAIALTVLYLGYGAYQHQQKASKQKEQRLEEAQGYTNALELR